MTFDQFAKCDPRGVNKSFLLWIWIVFKTFCHPCSNSPRWGSHDDSSKLKTLPNTADRRPKVITGKMKNQRSLQVIIKGLKLSKALNQLLSSLTRVHISKKDCLLENSQNKRSREKVREKSCATKKDV